MPTHYPSLPDVAFDHHPDHGIVAANPKQLVSTAWMLARFDFHPLPDQPTLYALADQQHDGPGRTSRAVALLREVGYQVDVDAAYDPSLASRAHPTRDQAPRADPEVAFAEHPQLGIVAATSDHSSALGGQLILEENGWRLDPNLDIYTLPVTADRTESVQKVASATVAMQRSGLQVAVHPRLARDAALRRAPAPTSAERLLPGQGAIPNHSRNAAALAASPARSGLRDKAPTPAAAASGASGRPVDPRIAFSRSR
ncbi:hypothetical protein [Streptomyces sp. SM13]|uniref:hypothetical protein n=1 Tax=Streptomyces sp. SM13 TaxID=1983803 RepID=UPI000CD4CC8F|nr:hypothetical protein [Streptomyces sp. SM13]